MQLSNEYVDSIQKLNLRIDEIEKLIQLLLINSLVEDAESVIQKSKIEIDSNVNALITQFGLVLEGFRCINEIEVLSVAIPTKARISIKDIKQIYFIIKSAYPTIEPLFMYQSINGMQRKRIMQEKISFGVKGKELYVTNGVGKSKWT